MRMIRIELTPLEFRELQAALEEGAKHLQEIGGDEDIIEYLTNAKEIVDASATD